MRRFLFVALSVMLLFSTVVYGQKNFTVLRPDPHGFDGNKDGIGCES